LGSGSGGKYLNLTERKLLQNWKKIRKKKDISYLRSSRNIVRLIKYERIKSMGLVANNGENVNAYIVLWGNLKLGMQCKCNLTLRRLVSTIVAVEKQ
jgi:hypothetical protein